MLNFPPKLTKTGPCHHHAFRGVTILSESEATPDVEGPLPYFIAQTDEYPLGRLDPRRFEILAEQLLIADIEEGCGYDRVALMPAGADKGRDIVLYRAGRPIGVVQCKRYARACGLREIVEEAVKFLLAGMIDPDLLPTDDATFTYHFWTALDLTAEGRRLFDETAATMPSVEQLVPNAIERLRKQYPSLRLPHDPNAPRPPLGDEVKTIAERLVQWTWTHTGSEDIAKRLNRHGDVRRRFFRGHHDTSRVTSAEIEARFDTLRSRQIADWEERNRSVAGIKIPRPTLDEHFRLYDQSGATVLALVGGTGLGKSSWLIQLLERSRPGLRVHLLRGEDIAAGDDNALSSLLRVLTERNPGDVPTGGIAPAFWSWLDDDNRLILIDGLDRVSSAVRERLGAWLDNTWGLTRIGPVRFVLTSRPEHWRSLAPGFQGMQGLFYRPYGEASSPEDEGVGTVLLEPLNDEETAAFHAAFAVPFARRPLRTPSLIATAARIPDDRATSRLRVFRSRLQVARSELAARGFGTVVAGDVLRRLGLLLLESDDGRLDRAQVLSTGPAGLIDEMLHSEILVCAGGDLRVEQDELAELLMGEVLEVAVALDQIETRHEQPLFVGAFAMAVAVLESRDPEAARSLLMSMLDKAGTSWGWWEVVARAVGELEDHQSAGSLLETLIRQWPFSNFAVSASSVGHLLLDLKLEDAESFELLLPLAGQEDPDDWRIKYWFDPVYAPARSGFGAAVLAIASRSAAHLVARLLDLHEQGGIEGDVALGMLLEGMAAHGPVLLEAAFERRARSNAFEQLIPLDPAGVMRLVDRRLGEGVCDVEEAVRVMAQARADLLYARSPASENEVRSLSAMLAERWLEQGMSDWSRAKLIVTLLETSDRPCSDHEAELLGLIPVMDRFDVWRAVGAARTSTSALLEAAFARATSPEDDGRVLEVFDAARIAPTYFDMLIERLRSAALSDTAAAGRPVAEAIERLLYAEDRDSHTAALDLAISLIPALGAGRRPLIFYSGTPAHGPSAPRTAARERLFAALVAAEDGATVDTLVWKLFQSAGERPDPVRHLRSLVDRLGYERVREAADRHARFELDGRWLQPELQAMRDLSEEVRHV